jgi:hypothetical protein
LSASDQVQVVRVEQVDVEDAEPVTDRDHAVARSDLVRVDGAVITVDDGSGCAFGRAVVDEVAVRDRGAVDVRRVIAVEPAPP